MIALEASASFWDTVSVYAAVAVFFGVAAECVAEFEAFTRWGWLAFGRRRSTVAKSGLLLLVAAFAVEVVAAIGAHNANEQIVNVLNGRLNTTIRQADDLAQLTKALRLSNAELQKEVSGQSSLLDKTGGQIGALSKHSAAFEQSIRTQEARDNDALVALQKDESKLTAARAEVLENADAVAGDAAKVATELETVQAMRQRMQEIVTPRQIDDAHFEAMVSALKPFANTPIDFEITRDNETIDLLVRITDALKAAGWAMRPPMTPGFPLSIGARPDLPAVGESTTRGVHVNVFASDMPVFGYAATALITALRDAGIPTDGNLLSAPIPLEMPSPAGEKPGRIHLIVGAKP
jgi:hypothetical protein